jgi:predicted ester cyclase
VVVVPVSKGVVATGDLRHATRVVSVRRLVQTAVAPSSETKEIQMSNADPAAVATGFIDAYNAGDDKAMLNVCADNIHVTHHNRGVLLRGRKAFGELLAGFKGAFPDKKFVDRRGVYVDGENVLVEHTWTGTAQADVPGFAQNGEKAQLDLCTRYTVRDGLIVEYHDYG